MHHNLKIEYLDDATSFDAYVEYTHVDGSKGIIGIEVKYTEGDYRIGTKEEKAVRDPYSPYWNITRLSNLYKPDCYSLLITDQFRQIWRNQLLGESIKLKRPDFWKHFTLVMVYADGNTHVANVTQDYKNLLRDLDNLSFVPITYKSFLQTSKNIIENRVLREWLEWCEMRYVHN